MRPLFRSLFVLSIFAVITVHLSTGLLRDWSVSPALVDLIDMSLRALLIDPLGRPLAAKVLLGIGVLATILTFKASRQRSGSHHSTW